MGDVTALSGTSPSGTRMPRMFTLLGEYVSRRALAESTLMSPRSVCFVVPRTGPLVVGTRVVCHLRILGHDDLHLVRGVVVPPPLQLRGCDPVDVVVEAIGDDRLAFARLYAVARGLPRHYGARAGTRTSIEVSASLGVGEDTVAQGTLTDLSASGARFVATGGLHARRGTPISLRVRSGLLRTVEIAGQVAWSQRGQLGVTFGCLDAPGQHWVGSALRSPGSREGAHSPGVE